MRTNELLLVSVVATASFVRSLRDDSVENSLTIAVAIFNVLQWLSITAAPVIQVWE